MAKDKGNRSHTPVSASWRVIVHGLTDGATNMAIDEAIAEEVGRGHQPPTLRFYGWVPACLSLGYSQPSADIDWAQIRARGWDVVRRLSGGRAILHGDELTYSVCIPESHHLVSGSIVESYRHLSQGLLEGLLILGADVNAQKAENEDARKFKGPVCFEVPSDYEITLDGRKLIGSAQTRRSGLSVLQHGTLPLYGNLQRICDALYFVDEDERSRAKTRVAERACTLEQGMGKRYSFSEAYQAIQDGFTAALGIDFRHEELSTHELQRSVELRNERYTNEDWTYQH